MYLLPEKAVFLMQILLSFWDFFTKHFEGFATILTIGGAIYLYLRQKKESKQQIATLIINDIRNANIALKTVKDSFNSVRVIPDVTVLPENNWKKFSYLFSRDLDEDDVEKINNFFSNVERISYIITQYNNLFLQHIFTRMSALQITNLNLLATAIDAKGAKETIDELDKRFADPNISNSVYNPTGFYTNLEKYLPEVPDLLTSTVGIKLKQMANPPKFKLNLLFFLKKN